MKKIAISILTIIIYALFNLSCFAQDINWNTSPRRGFVFQISNKEAQKLLTRYSLDTIFNGLLHTQVDTFDVRKGWVNRPTKGHFILATIVENKLHCEYAGVFPYQVFLLKEYDALALQVLDFEGNVRQDAIVKFKLKRLRVDPETKTYRIENTWFNEDKKIVTVELEGFRSIFNIEKHDVPSWYDNYSNNERPSFYSYMITDKNKYKPTEKVRFKSYALSQSRSPLHKELEVWLSNSGNSKKVGKVEPHRPGSYASEFFLNDSLKLTLDKNYSLQLREKDGRIVSSSNFKYEDYELNGTKLAINLATDKQFYPAKNELFILATDANGLVLKDAKASILVKSHTIRETFQRVANLKDTLMFKEIDLDTKVATRVQIPSELFQKTNTFYEVNVIVRNSQNQLVERTVSATNFYSQYELTTRFSNDSIIYEMLKNGIPVKNASMKLQHNDEVNAKDILLPHKEKINPVVSMVSLKSDFISRNISMRMLIPQLELKGGIEKDSFNIQLQNPQKLEVSWYIYQGSELLQKGFGRKLDFKSVVTDRSQTYYVELLYSFGGEDRVKRKEYEFKDDYLKVSLDVPERVYPGQKTVATINVADQFGHPVSGVDLTALAVTSKLDYYLPDLPYYGTSSAPRYKKANYSKSDVNKRSAVLALNYKKWEQPAALDTMKYYQFTYPQSALFKHTIAIADSTQFAPYVMQEGIAKQIYVIELNRKPVYYSWVDRPNEYSFYVPTKGKVEVTVRLFDRILVFDSISFLRNKKTILGVDLDHLPENVNVIKIDLPPKKNKRDKVYPSFTPTEINRHRAYLSSFKHTEGYAYLETGKEFKPLFSPWPYSRKEVILVGPIFAGKKTYIGPNELKTTYQHTGGFTYAFEDNVVYKLNTDKLIPERLYNNSFKPLININDKVMTKQNFLARTNAENKWHPRNINLVNNITDVRVLLPEEKEASGFASFLFENCTTKSIVSPCQRYNDLKSDFNSIPQGLHNIIAVYNSGSYLKMDSINFTPYSKVVIDLNKKLFHLVDSSSRKWIQTTSENCFTKVEPRLITMRHSNFAYGNIKGTVYGDDNLPMPGVNIVVKGTTNGTVSGEDGRFAIDSDEQIATLLISFIGYQTKEIEVRAGSEVSVFLVTDVKQLQEVVVVGYGAMEKRELASSMSSLSGRVAGIQISTPEVAATAIKDTEDREGEERLYQELVTLNSIRSHFTDVGFWEPKLFTDKRGQSKFNITFPDDITRWEVTVYAMNRHLKTGTAHKSIKSFKPIMAELHVPQFLTQGDSAFLLGKVLNYTQDQSITGKIKWRNAHSNFEKDIAFATFYSDKIPVNAITNDSITTNYVFTMDDGYLDGEERTVPVVEQGIVRADGTLSILKNKENVNIKASAKENITVEILANQMDIYAGEALYLLNYKYDCNEQLASKLLGLISYRMLMQYEGSLFKYDKDVNKIIVRLLKNQNKDFLWSWWDVSRETSYWMSSHILRALKAASDAGYEVDMNIDNIARKAQYKFDILNQYSLSDTDLLQGLAAWDAKLDYAKYVTKLDTLVMEREKVMRKNRRLYTLSNSLLKEKLLLQEIRQLAKLPFQRDTMLHYMKDGIVGDVHFSDDKPSSNWYNDELSTNVIAYRIVKRDSLLKKLITPMQMYFLAERNKGQWNTYHSSNILMSLLPDLMAEGVSKKREAVIKLTGKVNSTIDKFPYCLELRPNEELKIRKESGLPVYFMQYNKERVTKAMTGVEGFEIGTSFSNDQSVLEAGKPVSLIVDVMVKKEANLEYVMIEVPIPGACSYADKTTSNNRIETHREYFKDRTVIFCENMKSGKYTFVIKLLPRFTGIYTINPAQVSLMYFPVVNANTDMKSVRVE